MSHRSVLIPFRRLLALLLAVCVPASAALAAGPCCCTQASAEQDEPRSCCAEPPAESPTETPVHDPSECRCRHADPVVKWERPDVVERPMGVARATTALTDDRADESLSAVPEERRPRGRPVPIWLSHCALLA